MEAVLTIREDVRRSLNLEIGGLTAVDCPLAFVTEKFPAASDESLAVPR